MKKDLADIVYDFDSGRLPLYSLNFGVITLLLKKFDVLTIQEHRPIFLLNVSLKILTKAITNRIGTVAEKIIKPTQTTFIKGHNIMEGMIVLHETIHEFHKRKHDAIILKLDFKKVYDSQMTFSPTSTTYEEGLLTSVV
jgi:hypothetical protein